MLEHADGSLSSLPPIEIIPAEGAFRFDYQAGTLAKSTQEICPGRFAPEVSAELKEQALRAHSRCHAAAIPVKLMAYRQGPDLSRNQYLAGPDQGLALSEGAQGQEGIEFADFLRGQIAMAARRVGK